jgi:hypothetical protein
MLKESIRAMLANLARYLLIAVVSLGVGIATNVAMRNGSEWKGDASFYLLVAEYSTFHVVALSVAVILSAVFSIRVRSILYLSVSVAGFLASTYLLSPWKFGGIHLFVICWGSLVLIALDYAWRSSGRHQDEEPSPS